jgi:hypothetical protein
MSAIFAARAVAFAATERTAAACFAAEESCHTAGWPQASEAAHKAAVHFSHAENTERLVEADEDEKCRHYECGYGHLYADRERYEAQQWIGTMAEKAVLHE